MTKRNERTSPNVTRDASAIMNFKAEPFIDADTKLECATVPMSYIRRSRRVAASALTQAPDKAEIQRLRERLEVTHVYVSKGDGPMRRRKVKPGEDIPDGIECRDATIELLGRQIRELKAELASRPKRAPAKRRTR